MRESFERKSEAKEKLHALESSGEFLFHGSPTGDIEILEPRQAKRTADLNNLDEKTLDGNPAVFATPYSDWAIFKSIANAKNNFLSISRFQVKPDYSLVFKVISENSIDQIGGRVGYVYVFNKKDFEPLVRGEKTSRVIPEWKSEKPVKPIEIIEVRSEDLPDIEIVKDFSQ